MPIQEMLERYGQFIYNYALKLSCHPVDAEDLTQETFIIAWEKQDSLREQEALGKWLRTICYRQFLMSISKKGKKLEEPMEEIEQLEQEGKLLGSEMPTLEEEVIVAEEVRDLQNGCFLAMVRRLTLQQRIAFSLVDMFGLSIEEVASLLGLTKSAAKSVLYRGRMNIDSFFADHCHLIKEDNPCKCQAWINFSQKREDMQKQTRKLVEYLNYKEKGYEYDSVVRSKIHYLYSHMPEKKPSEEWYQKVIQSFQKK